MSQNAKRHERNTDGRNVTDKDKILVQGTEQHFSRDCEELKKCFTSMVPENGTRYEDRFESFCISPLREYDAQMDVKLRTFDEHHS